MSTRMLESGIIGYSRCVRRQSRHQYRSLVPGTRLNVERLPHQWQVPCQPSRLPAADSGDYRTGAVQILDIAKHSAANAGLRWHLTTRGSAASVRLPFWAEFFPVPAEKFALPLLGELPIPVKDGQRLRGDTKRRPLLHNAARSQPETQESFPGDARERPRLRRIPR
jgi:hypothetical protein